MFVRFFRPKVATLCLRASVAALAFIVPVVAHADDLAEIQKLMKAGRHAQALEKANAYIASKPGDAQGRFVKGMVLTEMNRPADAIAVFTKLTEDYPQLPEPYNNLAVLYVQQKQYEQARIVLEKAFRTHPAYAIAHENLNGVYGRLASQAYGKALQLDSSNDAPQEKLLLIRDLVHTDPRFGVQLITAPKPAEPVRPAVATAMNTAAKPSHAPVAASPAAMASPVAVAVASAAPATPAPVAKPASAPAATKPAPDSVPAKAAVGEEEVQVTVRNWAAAWSKKDVKAYLMFYASDFQTPDGMRRKDWEAERQQRISKPGKIQVKADQIKVAISGDKATVKFRQNYKSATLSTSAGKTLVLARLGGKWLIQQERVG